MKRIKKVYNQPRNANQNTETAYQETENCSSSNFWLGMLAGASVGAIAALLLAPDKGSNTRGQIVSTAGNLSNSLTQSYSSCLRKVESMVEELSHMRKHAGNSQGASSPAELPNSGDGLGGTPAPNVLG